MRADFDALFSLGLLRRLASRCERFCFVQEEVALLSTAHFASGGKQLPLIGLKPLAQQIAFDCHHT
jgi:hypothetical protein